MHKKTLNPPFPVGEGGGGLSFPSGGWGQKIKLKAKLAGDNESKPPAGYSGGRVEPATKSRPPAKKFPQFPLTNAKNVV